MRAKTTKPRVALPVRVTATAYARLQRLAGRAVHDGWRSLDAERTDLPTLAAVIDEALLKLEVASERYGR
jgi:hypothetical protein